MLVKSKFFGDIELEDDKIIMFDHGILGFEHCTRFTILYDIEAEHRPMITWMQSLDEQALAIPVISPSVIKPDYNPVVENDMLLHLGELTEDNLMILTTLTVPTDLTMMTTNLKAPIIINSDTRKGCQVVAENQEYEVKYKIYELLQNKKAKGDDLC